jgi:carboxypeptidase Q
MKEPRYSPLIGFARPWSPGTNGPMTGEPVLAPIHTEADLEKFTGKLKGKIVLLETPRPSEPISTALMRRLTDAELAAEGSLRSAAAAGSDAGFSHHGVHRV